MSLRPDTDLQPEASTSSQPWYSKIISPPSRSEDAEPTSSISLNIPTSLLLLPPTAALIGMGIGMSRGGSRARLRFLAENAHRQPKTVQGWYFYTKTRNYRVFFAALRTGAKYAAALGGATSVYVVTDEAIGWTREYIFHPELRDVPLHIPRTENAGDDEGLPHRRGWRRGPVHLEDGAGAGGLLGGIVGLVYRLPNPLLLRSVLIGTLLGTLTSGLQIVQARIGQVVESQAIHDRAALPAPNKAQSRDGIDVDRPVIPGDTIGGVSVDESPPYVVDEVKGEAEASSWMTTLGLGRFWGGREPPKN